MTFEPRASSGGAKVVPNEPFPDEVEVSSGAPIIASDTYHSQLKTIEVATNPDDGGKFLVWRFKAAVDGDIVDVDGTSSLLFTPKSKATEWTGALLGRALVEGEKLKITDFADRFCRTFVENNAQGWPKVSKVLPPNKATETAFNAAEPPARPAMTNSPSPLRASASAADENDGLPF